MTKKIYECGTLRYSLGGLIFAVGLILFAFFSYIFASQVVNTLIPLQLKDTLGADNKTIAIITGTIGGIFNITICPMVSFKSDRYRSRWGRRIPFILWTLPMYVCCILLFAFSGNIADFIRNHSGLIAFAPATVTIFTIAVVMVFYQFFYMFVGSVIHYIYNDVVPVQFQARVVGAVQVASTIATTVFNLFLLKYSLSHFKWLMILAAVVYTVGVGLMCLLLKETEYPPVSEADEASSKGITGIITFARESFSHPFYLYGFLAGGLSAVSGVTAFLIFFNQNMGLSLESIGKLYGVQGIIGTVVCFVGAAIGTFLIDRWHPMRVYLFVTLLALLEPLGYLKFIFGTPSPLVFWWSCLLLSISLKLNVTFYGFSTMPMLMRTYPQSRFGQFCSAAAMLRSVLVLIFGFVLGVVIDLLKYQVGLGDWAYRYIWLWRFAWMLPATIFFVLSYRQWLKLGGDRYQAPAPWSEKGREDMPVTDIVYPTAKNVKLGLAAVGVVVVLHVIMSLLLSVLAFVKYGSAWQFLSIAVPFAAAASLLYVWISGSVCRDLRTISGGGIPKNGIPHHGLLFLSAISILGMSIIGFMQAYSELANISLSVWFWVSESLNLMFALLLIQVAIRIERGFAFLAEE